MKKTGQLLKDSREKKNLSLHEIGMSLKINPKTLQAMEDGDTTKLPAKSFLRGFVKSYAVYLKLDANEVLAVFQSEVDPTPASTTSEPLPIQAKVEPVIAPTIVTAPKETLSATTATVKTAQSISIKSMPSADQTQDSFFTNKFLLSVGGAVLVILIVSTAKLVEKYQKERVVDQAQVQQIQTELRPQEATPNPNVDEKVIAEAPTEVLKSLETKNEENKSTIVKKEELKKEEPKKEEKKAVTQTVERSQLAQTLLTPHLITTPIPAKTAQTEKTEIKKEEKVAEAKPEIKPEAVTSAKPTEVIVEALNNVMIKYSLGDGKMNTLELTPEQLHTFKSKTVVELDISDGGSVSLIVNGRERGVPGSAGKPLKLVYPKQ